MVNNNPYFKRLIVTLMQRLQTMKSFFGIEP